MSEVKINGLAELQRALDGLTAKIEQNIVRGAVRAGAKVMADEAKALVPVDQGDLRDSIRVSVRARRGVVTAKVTAGNKKAFYANWVEFGTAAHKIVPKKAQSLIFGTIFADKVDHPGSRPKPFMRPAIDGKASQAVVAAGEYIRKRLTKQGINTPDLEVEA